MPRRTLVAGGGIAALAAATLGAAAEELPSREEMWRRIEEQQRQIEALQQRQERTDEKVEAAGETAERVQEEVAARPPGWWERTSLGGYGELHYNAGDRDQIDFHRFVLYVDHEFNDWLRLYSEVELEHALTGGGEPGEVELEQAYLEFDYADRHGAQAGLFLVPVGILNPTHEPPTFFGVERNPVETNIIPTTWWEAGAGFTGRFDSGLPGALGRSFAYELDVHSGLDTPTTGGNAFRIRNGRQKVAEAPAEDPAVTGRLRWTGLPGVEVAATGQYQSDLTQADLDVDATLFTVHTDARRGPWGLRALFARWDLMGNQPERVGRDVQWGWYVEPSVRFPIGVGDLGLFARYNQWDNTAGDDSTANSEFEQVDFGVNYWPHPDVALKADYQIQYAPTGTDGDDRVNAGVGFQF